MKKLCILILMIGLKAGAQLTCSQLRTTGISYNCFDIKNGTGKLFHTDTAITHKMKYQAFELKKVSELSPAEKNELKEYKISYNATDTIMFYDWDVLLHGQIGYHGKAVGKVRIGSDSVLTIQKYILKKGVVDYVPTHYKIFKFNESGFIIYNKDHPYLNINYYFKKP